MKVSADELLQTRPDQTRPDQEVSGTVFHIPLSIYTMRSVHSDGNALKVSVGNISEHIDGIA